VVVGYRAGMDNSEIRDERARTFATALQEFERSTDPAGLVALFTADAGLTRLDARGERQDPEAFWREYRDQFDELSTTFEHVVEGDDRCALEWTSRGRLSTGRPIEYRGVTVLEFAGQEVAQLRTYYDTAAFTLAPAGTN
jgi:ketosteroid isomerase-like protein